RYTMSFLDNFSRKIITQPPLISPVVLQVVDMFLIVDAPWFYACNSRCKSIHQISTSVCDEGNIPCVLVLYQFDGTFVSLSKYREVKIAMQPLVYSLLFFTEHSPNHLKYKIVFRGSFSSCSRPYNPQ